MLTHNKLPEFNLPCYNFRYMNSTKNEFLVSIIMPVYNSQETLEKSIQSVLNQSYNNWELIIVDDCSTDKSRKIISEYAKNDMRILPIFNDNKAEFGAADVRNDGLRIAKGKYIMFLDSDDVFLSNKIRNQIQFMVENDVWFSYSDYYVYSDKTRKVFSTHKTPESITFKELLKKNDIGCLTACYDREKLGLFYMPTEAYKREDFATWLLILKKLSQKEAPAMIQCIELKINPCLRINLK